MKTYDYKKSQELFRRAAKVIPCGVPGHMSPTVNIPPTDYPIYAVKSDGAKFWDVDGNEFIDYLCAYGPMILGYNNKIVDDAALAQLKEANLTMCASPRMVELAEYLDVSPLLPYNDQEFHISQKGDTVHVHGTKGITKDDYWFSHHHSNTYKVKEEFEDVEVISFKSKPYDGIEKIVFYKKPKKKKAKKSRKSAYEQGLEDAREREYCVCGGKNDDGFCNWCSKGMDGKTQDAYAKEPWNPDR